MPKKPVTLRSLRALKTRKKLFQSAVQLIEKHGYDNVTIEEVCSKAGVSVGAFYHYFNSKTDIIVELFQRIDTFFEEVVTPKLNLDASSNIDTFFHYYANFHADHGVDHAAKILQVQGDFFLDQTRYMHTKLTELVEAAIEDGTFASGSDPQEIKDYLMVMARGLILYWTLSQGGFDLIARMDTYIKLAKRSFK